VRRGEVIPLSAFTAGEGEITRGIIEHGGLFNYNMARLRGDVVLHPPETKKRPMTLGEKILARRWVVDPAKGKIGVPAVKPGDEGFVLTDIRFSHEYVTPMAAIFFEQLVGKDAKVNDPGSILMFRDHLTFLPEAMTPERVKEGLLDVALQIEKKQREFATAPYSSRRNNGNSPPRRASSSTVSCGSATMAPRRSVTRRFSSPTRSRVR
jgi:3-isopropylmalate/(R)-2-methylmalate dehydratase large subunit